MDKNRNQLVKKENKLKNTYDNQSCQSNINANVNVISSIRQNYHNVSSAIKPRTNSQKPVMMNRKKYCMNSNNPSLNFSKQPIMKTDVNIIAKIMFGSNNIQALNKKMQGKESTKQIDSNIAYNINLMKNNPHNKADSPDFVIERGHNNGNMYKRNIGSSSKSKKPIEFSSSIDNQEIYYDYNNDNVSFQKDKYKQSLNQHQQTFHKQSSTMSSQDKQFHNKPNSINVNNSNSFNIEENERNDTEVFVSPPKFMYSISPLNKYSPSKYNNIKYTRTSQKETNNKFSNNSRETVKNRLNCSSNNINHQSEYYSCANINHPKQTASLNISNKQQNNFPQLVERNIPKVQLKYTARPLSSVLNGQGPKDKYGNSNPSASTKYNLTKQPQLNIHSIHNSSNTNLRNVYHSKVKSPKIKDRRPFSQIHKKSTVEYNNQMDKNISLNTNSNNTQYNQIDNDRRITVNKPYVNPNANTNVNSYNNAKNNPELNKVSFTNRRIDSNISLSHQSNKTNKNYPVITVSNRGTLQINSSSKPTPLMSFEPRISIPIINPKKTINSNHTLNNHKNNHSDSKQAYLTKMAKMDDDKFQKIIQIVDRLDNSYSNNNSNYNSNCGSYTNNEKNSKVDNSNKKKHVDPFINQESPINKKENDKIISINYINADTINLGNININYTNYNNDSNAKNCDDYRFTITILSNWGHTSKIGFNCIELFNKDNDYLKIKEATMTILNPSPSLSHKSIMPISLKGRLCSIKDDDMFACDYSPNQCIEIISESILSYINYIKLWNYNGKDTSKGIKDIEVFIKGDLIYKGTCKRGKSNLKDDYSTMIPFPSNQSPLPKEDKCILFYNDTFNCNEESSYKQSINSERRNTKGNLLFEDTQDEIQIGDGNNNPNANKNSVEILKTPIAIAKTQSQNYDSNVIWCNKIKIILSNNYGHKKFIGLTGLQFFDENKELINIEQASSIGAMPKDIRNYYNNDDFRIFENVFNGINTTKEDSHMWLTVKKPNEPLPYLEIVFENQIGLSSIKIWNYNSVRDLDKGAKTIELYFDESLIDCPYHKTIHLRRGIGYEGIDYSQNIIFPYKEYHYTEEELEPYKTTKFASFLYNQSYETPYLPCGLILKFALLSTWGSNEDQIGLNKIELYNQLGKKVLNKRNSSMRNYTVLTYPPSLIDYNNDNYNNNDDDFISQLSTSNRIENIINNANTSNDQNEGWLTSYSSELRENIIYIIFRYPISLSYIKIFNYTKRPNCGIKDISISFDDQRIFEGQLNQITSPSTSNKEKDNHCSNETIILFTCDLDITKHLDEDKLSKPLTTCSYNQSETENQTVLACCRDN